MRRLLPILAAVMASVTVVAGCGSQQNSSAGQTPQTGGTLTFATGDDEPACLDPAVTGTVPQALAATQYIETLFYQDDAGKISPWLAKSWTVSPGGLSVEIITRADVSFSDGTPFNAEAVKVSLDHIRDPATKSSTGASALARVSAIEVTGPDTVTLRLSQPDNALLESLAQVWLPIESPAALERGVQANCESPVGTGPFIVNSWARNNAITLVRNENYTSPPPGAKHTGPAYLDTIVWRFLPDDSSRFSALQAGDVDVIDRVAPESVKPLETAGKFTLDVSPRPGYPVSVVLNSTRSPFDDIRVREAFIRSLDVNAGLSSVFFGTVPRANSVLSSANQFHVDTPEYYAGDPEKAIDLLQQAGWVTGSDGYRHRDGQTLTVEFLVNSGELSAQRSLYEQFQASAKGAGFDLNLKSVDIATKYELMLPWNYGATGTYYTKNSPNVLSLIFDSANKVPVGGYHSNTTGVSDPRLDEILRTAAVTPDEAQRAELYEQAQTILAQGYYQLPLYDQQTRLGINSQVVHDVTLFPSLSLPSFYDTWVSR